MLKVAVISKNEKRVEKARLQRLKLALLNLSKYSELWVISPMNLGLETEAAEIAAETEGIRLECAIPFEEQASAWSEEERERYFGIIEKSLVEQHVTKRRQKNSEYLCYNYLLENADLIILATPPGEEIYELCENSGKRIIKI